MYRKRIADQILSKRLRRIGAVQILGPKWCGKTTTAEQKAKSVIYMDEPEHRNQNIAVAEINPRMLLSGENPRLIDEWQIAPKIWDAVRFEVDHRKGVGLFILTGSSIPPDTQQDKGLIYHSGAGRISRMLMRTMSLLESGDSTGTVSLEALFQKKDEGLEGQSRLSLKDVAYLICRGGWPGGLELDREDALGIPLDYFDVIVNQDISGIDHIERDSGKVKRFMRSYARNQGTQASMETIRQDLDNKGDNLAENTVASYISALKRLFVIEDMQAWNPNLRSKTAVRTLDTRYFIDPSIATASLGVGPEDLISDLNTMGFLFETLCVRDLRVYAEALDGDVYHYRDKSGQECDAVIHLRNGSYGLIEIKIGGDTMIEEGAKSLLRLSGKIDTSIMKGVTKKSYRLQSPSSFCS